MEYIMQNFTPGRSLQPNLLYELNISFKIKVLLHLTKNNGTPGLRDYEILAKFFLAQSFKNRF